MVQKWKVGDRLCRMLTPREQPDMFVLVTKVLNDKQFLGEGCYLRCGKAVRVLNEAVWVNQGWVEWLEPKLTLSEQLNKVVEEKKEEKPKSGVMLMLERIEREAEDY